MFSNHGTEGYTEPLPGIRMKTLCHGANTLMAEFCLETGSKLPLHAHVYEQTGYLVSGCLKLTIGAEVYEVKPGDSWCIPGNVDHGAHCLENAVAIEVFSPVREDYLQESSR